MNLLRSFLVVSHLLLLVSVAVSEEPRDQDLIQGKWRLEDQENFFDWSPSLAKPEGERDQVIEFHKDSIQYFQKGRQFADGKFELNSNENPKQINFTMRVDEKVPGIEPLNRVGIYALKGDSLVLCFDTRAPVRESFRPKDFQPKPNSGYILLRLKRISDLEPASKK